MTDSPQHATQRLDGVSPHALESGRALGELAPEAEPERQRVRIVYEKGEAIKFISHQDEFRAWERALRRADLPLLYKQGFNPQPHIQFASPLGVGICGRRELLDIVFSPPLPLDQLRSRIESKLPLGLTLHAIEETPFRTDALQKLLLGADYTILIYAAVDEVAATLFTGRIGEFLGRDELWRERQRKGAQYTYNLRPLVFELCYEGYDPSREEHRIFLRVQQRAGATGRPDEVVAALGLDDYARTLRRERLYLISEEEDVARFSKYRLVEKEEIEVKRRDKWRSRRSQKNGGLRSRPGRTISERAGDEFD